MAEDVFALEDRYNLLREASEQGISEIDYQGRRIRYRSMEVMDKAIQRLGNRIAALRGTSRPPSVRGGTIYSTKGIC